MYDVKIESGSAMKIMEIRNDAGNKPYQQGKINKASFTTGWHRIKLK
jgi:hypothetical protein